MQFQIINIKFYKLYITPPNKKICKHQRAARKIVRLFIWQNQINTSCIEEKKCRSFLFKLASFKGALHDNLISYTLRERDTKETEILETIKNILRIAIISFLNCFLFYTWKTTLVGEDGKKNRHCLGQWVHDAVCT